MRHAQFTVDGDDVLTTTTAAWRRRRRDDALSMSCGALQHVCPAEGALSSRRRFITAEGGAV